MNIRNLSITFPIYLPDATRGVVRNLDSVDLKSAGVEGVVVNTMHLADKPGIESLQNLGGVKGLMNFKGLVVSDSGGWQVFSLIHRSNTNGSITDQGIKFTIGTQVGKIFTPEKSIKIQFDIGSHILICLDDFTPPNAGPEKIKESVDRTILWAKKSKAEYVRQIAQRNFDEKTSPLLFSVIQGGWDKEMRKYCAQKLIEIGFDGYGFGGYVIDPKTKKLDLDISKYIADLIPDDKLKFALGVGTPHDISMCSMFGWQIFDCTLPTRDARHKRLYNFTQTPKSLTDMTNPDTYTTLYIKHEKHKKENKPISEFCDCYTCRNFTLAYLSHLFNIGDSLGYRLATIHNLRHYTLVTDYLRKFLGY